MTIGEKKRKTMTVSFLTNLCKGIGFFLKYSMNDFVCISRRCMSNPSISCQAYFNYSLHFMHNFRNFEIKIGKLKKNFNKWSFSIVLVYRTKIRRRNIDGVWFHEIGPWHGNLFVSRRRVKNGIRRQEKWKWDSQSAKTYLGNGFPGQEILMARNRGGSFRPRDKGTKNTD